MKLPLRAVLIMLAIGVSLCCGCASFSPSGSLPWKNAPPVDASTFAAHQTHLMIRAGESAERQGSLDEAIRLYEQARNFDPGAAHLSRRLAVLYDQRGDNELARAAYEHALQLQPHDPDLLNDFGVHHLHREDWAAAETWFRRSLSVEPTHHRATNNLATSLAMQNRLTESYELFSRVVGPAAAYSNLGVLLTRQGRIEEAREHLQRALALDRTVQSAAELLGRLDRRSEATNASTSQPSVQPVNYQPELDR